MLDPSGIRASENSKLVIKEVKPGLYTIENAYQGVYEYFAETPIVEVKPTSSEESLEDWREEFGTDTKLSLIELPVEAFDTSDLV